MTSNKECGFVYEPGNELEVCILFGFLMSHIDEELKKLGFEYSRLYLEEYQDTFPDCNLLMDNKIIRAEFELNSSNFKYHPFHDPKRCDLIICWKDDWLLDCPLPVLELSKVVSNKKDISSSILNHKPKYADRGTSRWKLAEFRDRLKDKVIAEFVDGLLTAGKFSFQMGKGKKIVTLNIGIDGKTYPLWIDDTGKAGISYYNVNMNGSPAILAEDKITKIRDFLGESDRLPQPRLWHYIEAKNSVDLVRKLVKTVAIMAE